MFLTRSSQFAFRAGCLLVKKLPAGYFAAGGGNVADEVIMQNIGGHLS
jgi:hypothetical protein